MPTRFIWTDDLDDQLRDLAANGTPVRQMAVKLGTSKSVIARRITALGIGVDRTRTLAATAANHADAKARRAALQLALLGDAERLRRQLWEPAVVFNFGGRDNTFEQRTLDKPPFADQLKISQATGIMVDRSLKLAEHDDDTGTAAIVGLLQQTAAALGITDRDDTQP